jgi:hypothetical protein
MDGVRGGEESVMLMVSSRVDNYKALVDIHAFNV